MALELKVKVFPNKQNGSPTLAFASAAIPLKDGSSFYVNGIRWVRGPKKDFVAMPQEKIKKGDKVEYKDIAFGNGEFRKALHEAISGEYAKLTKQN